MVSIVRKTAIFVLQGFFFHDLYKLILYECVKTNSNICCICYLEL